jgi:hypothetical protein
MEDGLSHAESQHPRNKPKECPPMKPFHLGFHQIVDVLPHELIIPKSGTMMIYQIVIDTEEEGMKVVPVRAVEFDP